jgi:hypothetical protein
MRILLPSFPKAGTGAFEGDRSQGVNGYVMNAITPESDKSCHYFWAFMRNYRLDSQLITTQLRQVSMAFLVRTKPCSRPNRLPLTPTRTTSSTI